MTDHIYLAHHGIKGMKWGLRRFRNEDGTLTEAGKKRYSDDQFKRDKSVYGRAGAKRIQKRVEKNGESVSGARSKEATRINSARRRGLVLGQAGAAVGGVGGAIGGAIASKYVRKILSEKSGIDLSDPSVAFAVGASISAGVAKVGETLGREGGRAVGMLSGGYNPNKYKNG